MVNQVTLMVYEIIEKVAEAKKREEKIEILRQYNHNWALKDILRGTYDDKIQWKEILRGFDIQSGINKLNFKRSAANYFKVEIKPLNAISFGNGGAGTLPWTFIDEIQFIRN